MSDTELKLEAAKAAVKGGPGLAGAVYYSLTLNEWVAVVTIIYFLLQIGLLILKYVDRVRGKAKPE